MSLTKPALAPARRAMSNIVAALVVSAALVGVVGCESTSASSAPSPRAVTLRAHGAHDSLPGNHSGRLGEADGVVPDGTTVFDDALPAVAHLDPALRRALHRAATDAADDGVTFTVNSGWRSRRYQDQLFREAVSTYGSATAAARWVAAPGTSAHESGDAVDIGSSAAVWLAAHGATYGLCRVYGNEPWHYELRPDAVHHGCPPVYADPTQDPRMHR